MSLLSRLNELLSPYGKSLVVQWRKVASIFLPRVFKGFGLFKAFVKNLSIRLLTKFGELLGPYGKSLVGQWRQVSSKFLPSLQMLCIFKIFCKDFIR